MHWFGLGFVLASLIFAVLVFYAGWIYVQMLRRLRARERETDARIDSVAQKTCDEEVRRTGKRPRSFNTDAFPTLRNVEGSHRTA